MTGWFSAPVTKTMAAFGFALVVAAAPALAQTPAAPANPGQFISGLGSEVIHLIGDQQQSDAQRKQRFAGLVRQAFDVDGIARFILGSYWRGAKPQQRSEFAQVFATYMIDVYWSDFSRYSGQELKVTGQRKEGADTTIVSSEIEQSNGRPPVEVDWRVHSGRGGLKISDVSIDGVSELITYRQEFGDVIAQAGGNIDALTAQLKHKIEQIGGA